MSEKQIVIGITYYSNGDGTYTSYDELHQNTITAKELEILKVLTFMQRHDKNGQWLEWLDMIQANESDFDKAYVIETLQAWYDDTGESVYANMIEKVDALKI